MSPHDSQIGFIIAGNGPGFVQNGQIDWIRFGETVWKSSASLLQRFAIAGVQPATYCAGLALGYQFELDHVGVKRVHDALDRLPRIPGLEKIIEFGFGVRSLVRVMSDSQLGLNCVALCSALCEMHDVDTAAWILAELWKVLGYPRQYQPSHSQFAVLVRACSGVLIKTPFSRIAERMLDDTDGQDDTYGVWGIEGASSADLSDIAKALQGLFKISTGKVARISVHGGSECAFMAALAHWLFNLKVHVEDRNGSVLYQDTIPEAAQVFVAYRKTDDHSLVELSTTTYLLYDTDRLWYHNTQKSLSSVIFRTSWDHCLARAYGSTCSLLLSRLPHLLGSFLGSVARIYRALASGESISIECKREYFLDLAEPSFGQGFVTSTVCIFPELDRSQSLKDHMQEAEEVSCGQARRTAEPTVVPPAQSCQCSCCTPRGVKSESRCLVAVTMSVRRLISLISSTVRDPDILPTLDGLRTIYSHMHADVASKNGLEGSLLPIALGLRPHDTKISDMQADFLLDILTPLVELFSAGTDRIVAIRKKASHNHQEQICTAIVEQGLCYYLDCLRETTSQAATMRLVHIIPGHIQMEDRLFTSIFDPQPLYSDLRLPVVQCDNPEDSNTCETMNSEQQPFPMVPPSSWNPHVTLKAFAQETSVEDRLLVFLEASIEGDRKARILPGELTRAVLRRTGLVICNQCNERLALPCHRVCGGWRIPRTGEWPGHSTTAAECHVWPELSNAARCVAIQLNESLVGLFLRRHECLSCCTITMTQNHPGAAGWPTRLRYFVL